MGHQGRPKNIVESDPARRLCKIDHTRPTECCEVGIAAQTPFIFLTPCSASGSFRFIDRLIENIIQFVKAGHRFARTVDDPTMIE
jgi:hypothetical protein